MRLSTGLWLREQFRRLAGQGCQVTGKFWKICCKIRLSVLEKNEPSGNHNMSAFGATHMRAHVRWN